MAKEPQPGRSKTRLVSPDGFTPNQAAAIAAAMLRCIVTRLVRYGRCILAVTPDGCGTRMIRELHLPPVEVIDQGAGDLGQRLDRVWGRQDPHQCIAFFGMDSPDVPASHLDAISRSLQSHDLAVGPTDDGGYWVLGARGYRPTVLHAIDWGTDRVYHQTRARAQRHQLGFHQLPAWDDVDTPDDVRRLIERLSPDGGVDDPALVELHEALSAIVPSTWIHRSPQE
jgi:rSAM/selenodomain-associated transferase 1